MPAHPSRPGSDPGRDAPVELEQRVAALVDEWVRRGAAMPASPAARRLADLLGDPGGLAFTVGFVDGVIRPDDHDVAAANLRALAVSEGLPWHLRAALRLARLGSRAAPHTVVRVVRRVFRRMVGHLVVDASDARLGRAIAALRRGGVRLNVNLLGEAVLGAAEAQRRLDGTRRLLARDDVDYVSLKVSASVAPHSPWAFDAAVDHIADRLLPLYRLAAAAPTPKFINLDMEEYRDLDLTIAVFTRLLDLPELGDLAAGIVLQAYLPDALAAMQHLQGWAATRRANGGAPIKVRLVKGANLPMERVEAELRGWPLATWGTKQETDTNYKRVLRWALTRERVANVRLGVAGHNLFDVAYAWLLAGDRDARDGVEFEMLLGMAEGQAAAVADTVGGLLLYTPVVHPGEFDVAIAYLVRRLDEGASSENFMSAVFDLHRDPALSGRERHRFRAALTALEADDADHVPRPHRVEHPRGDRVTSPAAFANVADTDPSVPANRAWAAAIAARIPTSTLGVDLVATHTVTDPAQVDQLVRAAATAGAAWGRRTGAERAAVLRRAAIELERRRAELIEVMGAECGKTLDQGDPEVSEAVDFANYYADLAEALDAVDGATAHPVGVTLVTPPWNFPVAIPAGSTLAALAAGSAVVVKPAPQAQRCGSLMVAALWAAGVPADALHLVHVGEAELGRALVAHPAVDRVLLTGAFDTAVRFREFRGDLTLLAETSGKNAIVVTPAADLDQAVRDLVGSAFGHAGQKCSAASLGILVGSVATSARFRRQLVDAVGSLVVGDPADLRSQVGPLIEPAHGKLLGALTHLAPGEHWLVEPRQLDDTGRLWSPGVKAGVRPGSEFHRVEYFGPVLGLIAVADLAEAVAVQNGVDYGLTAGLHSLDPAEIESWLEQVEAGNVYVNRGITGAIVRRQPFGGWKRSAVGPGAKAGGPNALMALVDWTSRPATAGAALGPVAARMVAIARRAGLDDAAIGFLERAFRSDAQAWADEFGVARDVTGLRVERNVLRYRPVPVWVRWESGPLADLLRVVGAGLVAGADLRVSVARPLAVDLPLGVVVESDAQWAAAVAGLPAGRVRLIGGSPARFAAITDGRAELALYAQPVTEAGRVELLAFLREQAISITNHRFGTPGLADRLRAG